MEKTTKEKPKIYSFDIDGVIVDTASNALKLFNKKFQQNKKINDLGSFFEISKWLVEILKDESKATAEAISIWNDLEVLEMSKPVKGAVELSQLIQKSGHKAVYITSRPNYVKEVTIGWFKKWLPWVDKNQMFISRSAEGLQKSYKIMKIMDIKPDFHFEDSLEHAKEISESNPEINVLLVRQPWNYKLYLDLPKSVFVPVGAGSKRNLMATYKAFNINL